MTRPSRLLPLLLLAACGEATPPVEPPLSASADLAVAADTSAHGNPSNFVRLGGHWYLSAHHEDVGQELWRTDGTEQGTALVRDLAPGAGSSLGRSFPAFESNGALLFMATNGADKEGLWRTDGTTAGTYFLNDLGDMFNARRFLRANGFVYFLAEGYYVSVNLWRTDGTPEGTAFLRQLHPGGKYGSFPPAPRFESFVFRGELFTPAQGPEGIELWKADSTGELKLFMDFNPGTESSHPEQFLVDSERFFFVTGTSNGVRAHTLWVSDGTPAGTVRVKDFPTMLSSRLDLRDLSHGKLTFRVNSAQGSGEPIQTWQSDGTPEGTVPVELSAARAQALGRSVRAGPFSYFVHETEASGFELWRTDGTEAGTALVKDIHPGPGDANPGHLTAVGDVLYFSANDGESGTEPWRTDGTEAGTVRVVDLRPGALGSHPELQVSAGQLFFSADDGVTGRELYLSDGTAQGTRRVYDFNGPKAPVVPQPPGGGGTEEEEDAEDEKRGCSVAGSGAALPLLAVVLTGLRRRRERAKG